ncbi:MAG TPA: hypothetical protein VMP01_22465 [Pirellulaceae bacterium]|nr:hypothetical protein [Pirellulaceae bacterium]
MNWREVVFRFAIAIAWLLFGLIFFDHAASEPSLARDVMWIVAGVFSMAVALAIVILPLLPSGRLKWLAPCRATWSGRALVSAVSAIGIALFVVAQLGYVDVQPFLGRLLMLWLPAVLVLWVVLSATTESSPRKV